jgi:hypothetical protein
MFVEGAAKVLLSSCVGLAPHRRFPPALGAAGAVHQAERIRHGALPQMSLHALQFPNGIVSFVSFVSTTNTARSLAGFVLLALALIV